MSDIELQGINRRMEELLAVLEEDIKLKEREVVALEKIGVELGLMNSEKKAKANWLSKGDFKL